MVEWRKCQCQRDQGNVSIDTCSYPRTGSIELSSSVTFLGVIVLEAVMKHAYETFIVTHAAYIP